MSHLKKKYLLHYLESLSHWMSFDSNKYQLSVPEACWNLLKDILHCDILLKYRPQEISITIIYLIINCYQLEVPYDNEAKKHWWKVRFYHLMKLK